MRMQVIRIYSLLYLLTWISGEAACLRLGSKWPSNLGVTKTWQPYNSSPGLCSLCCLHTWYFQLLSIQISASISIIVLYDKAASPFSFVKVQFVLSEIQEGWKKVAQDFQVLLCPFWGGTSTKSDRKTPASLGLKLDLLLSQTSSPFWVENR